MYLTTIARSLGTTAACADAGTGLLIDCWRQAEKALGYPLDQAELSKAATAYQRITRPGSLAGWVFNGQRMVWQASGLGADVLPPDPLTIAKWAKIPEILPPNIYTIKPVRPVVTEKTLLAAAQLPDAPAAVKQTAAQLQAGGFDITGWFTDEMISGIPNYALLGVGVAVLFLLGRRRR